MADIEVGWEVEGILTPRESVEKMLAVIPEKGIEDTGTFWTWEGKVRVNPSTLLVVLPGSSLYEALRIAAPYRLFNPY
jgi:hypothetical protein